MTIQNVRNFEYQETGDVTERWETRSYDLDELVGVDVYISFWGPTLYGHTITSWEFEDVVSIMLRVLLVLDRRELIQPTLDLPPPDRSS